MGCSSNDYEPRPQVIETYLALGTDEWLFVRHNDIDGQRPTLLFLHGLGESGMSFREAFEDSRLDVYNRVVPDLVGYGRSSAASSEYALDDQYSFSTQCDRLWTLIDLFDLQQIILVGHSMGGDLATVMSASDQDARILGLVNVEGNLTDEDLFISESATEAAACGQFGEWFTTTFSEKNVYEIMGAQGVWGRRYYASLLFCRHVAFLANAREMYNRNQPLPGQIVGETGSLFRSLALPKVFCWGGREMPGNLKLFLKDERLDVRWFENASHWIMIDSRDEFYGFLDQFYNTTWNASDSGP